MGKKFMSEQGYDLNTIIKNYEEWKIIILKKKKTLRYSLFYDKGLIDRGIVQIGHCISDEMIADSFTKPLQGKRFHILRDLALEWENV